MAKFAVYYIPPADSEFYQRGSEILGYDARTGQYLSDQNATRAALPEFDLNWVEQPQTYGFHVTTGYSLYYDESLLPQIEQEMEEVMGCFSPGLDFTLTPAAERILFIRDEIVLMPYVPNANMLMLHTMLTARINPYGSGSNVSDAYAKRDPATIDPVNALRVKKYYTPYMLDGWMPHFTLMMPYTGTQRDAMHTALLDLFSDQPMRVESICLLVRGDVDTHYRLHREFFTQ